MRLKVGGEREVRGEKRETRKKSRGMSGRPPSGEITCRLFGQGSL